MVATTVDGQASCRFSGPNDGSIVEVSGQITNVDSIPWDKSGFLIAPFNQEKKLMFIDPSKTGKTQYTPDHSAQKEVSKGEYINMIKSAITQIRSGKMDKVVLSRVIERESVRESDRSRFFEALTKRYSDAFCYQLDLPDGTSWVGATPERLLKYKEGVVYMDALAGTLSLSDSPKWTSKEYREQKLVTGYIIDLLESIGASNIQTDGPHTKAAGQVCHLHTAITASTEPSRVEELISALHPTPAVCGTPKETAFDFIQRSEPHDRRLYSGYLGVMQDQTLDVFVNLRCMELLRDRSYIYVGGGITEGSDPVSEWEETKLKSQTMGTVLQNLHYI